MKLIYLKSSLKSDSFDVAIGIKIPFFRVLVTIEPGRSLLQLVTTNCLKTERHHFIYARTPLVASEQRQKISGPKEEMRELRRHVKCSVCLDHHEMWEDAVLSLGKTPCSHDFHKLYHILE